MPDASRAEPIAFAVPVGVRAGMVLFGLVPFLHGVATIAPIVLAANGRLRWAAAAWLAPVVLYLVPPIAVRLSTAVTPLPSGAIDLASRGFLHWWFTAQWQVVFLRFPWLEELLRMVPGLYSTWLRLWGARIGSLVFWSPGVVILDRSLLRVGDRVVFGMAVRISPHVLAAHGGRRTTLFLGPVDIGHDVLIGGYSLLAPGVTIAPGEVTPQHRTIRPFTRFADGRQGRERTIEVDD